jgi:hypothetical protein
MWWVRPRPRVTYDSITPFFHLSAGVKEFEDSRRLLVNLTLTVFIKIVSVLKIWLKLETYDVYFTLGHTHIPSHIWNIAH